LDRLEDRLPAETVHVERPRTRDVGDGQGDEAHSLFHGHSLPPASDTRTLPCSRREGARCGSGGDGKIEDARDHGHLPRSIRPLEPPWPNSPVLTRSSPSPVIAGSSSKRVRSTAVRVQHGTTAPSAPS